MQTVVSMLKDSAFRSDGLRDYFQYRDLDMTEATGGRYVVRVGRAVPGKQINASWHVHHADFRLLYILKGWMTFHYPDMGVFTLRMGDAIYQADDPHVELAHSDDLEILEVATPADFKTTSAAPHR